MTTRDPRALEREWERAAERLPGGPGYVEPVPCPDCDGDGCALCDYDPPAGEP